MEFENHSTIGSGMPDALQVNDTVSNFPIDLLRGSSSQTGPAEIDNTMYNGP